MSAATGSPEFLSWLSQFTDATEIRDAQGALVGVFVPQKATHAEQVKSLFDWETVKRRAASKRTGRQLQEIVHDLETRGNKQ